MKKCQKIKDKVNYTLKYIVDVYWRSLVSALVCYFLFHGIDLFFIKRVVEEKEYLFVYYLSFLVSFLIFSILRFQNPSFDEKNNENNKLTTADKIKKYVSSNWEIELFYLFIVSFGFIFVYFIFDAFSPFVFLYIYLSETVGFILSIISGIICRIIGLLVYNNRRHEVRSYGSWYKISIGAIVVIVAFILFSPESGRTEPRNIPLFCGMVLLFVLWSMVNFVMRVISFAMITNKLQLKRARDIKCNYFGIKNKCDLSYTISGKKHNVVFLKKVERRARHYFEDCGTIRRFVGLLTASRVVSRARISDQVTWREISEIRLPWKELKDNDNYVLVLKDFPTEIADHTSRDKTLGKNDMALGKILLLDKKGFAEYIRK